MKEYQINALVDLIIDKMNLPNDDATRIFLELGILLNTDPEVAEKADEINQEFKKLLDKIGRLSNERNVL